MSVSHLFQKGQSPNPGGLTSEHRRLAIDFRYDCAREASKRLPMMLRIIDNEDIPPNIRISAMNSLLDRGFGKPMQAIQIGDLPDNIPASQMTQAQLNMMIEGNFFGAVKDMLETNNERFLSLISQQTKNTDIKTGSSDQDASKNNKETQVRNTEKEENVKNKDACNDKLQTKEKTNDKSHIK